MDGRHGWAARVSGTMTDGPGEPIALWRGAAPLVLASTSPTRRDLLAAAGLAAETVAPGVDERAVAMSAGLWNTSPSRAST